MKIFQRPAYWAILTAALFFGVSKSSADTSDPVVVGATGSVALHHNIEVMVTGLKEWLETDPAKNDPSKIVLYLNGLPLKGVAPLLDRTFPIPPKAVLSGTQRPEAAGHTTRLGFYLERVSTETDNNLATWNSLLSRPSFADIVHPSSKARIALGYNTRFFPLESDVQVPVQKISPVGSWFVIILTIGIIWAITTLARQSNLLRDSGQPPEPGEKITFSLARSQMAFWFVLVVTSFVFIWITTGALDTLTPSVLGLIGISAATGFAGMVVDKSKRQSAMDQIAVLRTKKQNLLKADKEADLQAGDPRKDQIDSWNLEIQTLQAQLKSTPSQGFVLDILSDGDGVSLYRLQNAVWTIVAGAIFIASVYNSLSMPEFSETLLGLMAISGGTYVGFKIPSKP